jgi:hypothetical protein
MGIKDRRIYVGIISLLLSFSSIAQDERTLDDLAKEQSASVTGSDPRLVPVNGIIPVPSISQVTVPSGDVSSSSDVRSKYFVLSSIMGLNGRYQAWAQYGNNGFVVKEGAKIAGMTVMNISANGVQLKGHKTIWKVGETINAK